MFLSSVLKFRNLVIAMLLLLSCFIGLTRVNADERILADPPQPPDIAVKDIKCMDSTLTIDIGNIGPTDIPDDVNGALNIWIDGTLEWTYSWNTLYSQDFRLSSHSILIQPQQLSAGEHTIKACMEMPEFADWDETNNCMEKVITCGVSGTCDQTELENAYQAGYAAGLAAASANNCTTFDFITNTLHIPCLNLGNMSTYWLDMELISSDPIQLQLKNLGVN